MIPQEIYILYNILEQFLGKSKHELDESYQLQFPCPKCIEEKGEKEHHKYNLEVNLIKGVFHCWACSQIDNEMHGSILKLIKLYGNDDILRDYKLTLKSLQTSKLYQLSFQEGDFNIEFKQNLSTNIQLPDIYKSFDFTETNQAMKYLLDRGINKNIITKYRIGYTTYSPTDKKNSSRIILPSFNEYGELNYWTGRDYTNLSYRQKYFNPIVERKNIIFNEYHIEWDADITLVEGPFDHIVVPNSIPLLGKSLSQDFLLYQKLMTNANAHVNIFLDGDAFSNVKKIYKLLNHDKLYNKIRYIPVNENLDPSNIFQLYGKKGIVSCLRNASKIPEVFL